MAFSWTEDQLRAIEARGENILVSAAAGSGKTAVLVERVIRRVCNEKIPIDRFLIVTFTEAAADEMKRKISNAIHEKSRENPDDVWLRQQCLAVNSAQISTIHAFCKNILTNYIQETDLPATFSLIDQNENDALLEESIAEVLERYYLRIDRKKAFRDLALGYGGIKNADNLASIIRYLLLFTSSLAYPEKWLHNAAKEYTEMAKRGTYRGSVWEKLFCETARELVETACLGLRTVLFQIEQCGQADLTVYGKFCEMLEIFESCFAPLLSGSCDAESVRTGVDSLDLPDATGIGKLDGELEKFVKDIRKKYINKAKEDLIKLTDSFFFANPQQIADVAERIRVLKQLARQTERLHRSKKRALGKLDFNDLEHEAIRLLTGKNGKPGKVALLLREQYEEILVDEYQDVNRLQDTLFSLISEGKNNLFMVGDFKQCIYQFRNANPQIFREKQDRFSRHDGGTCIFLRNNFRSRSQIPDITNATMEMLMSDRLGGKDYDENDALVFGASYYPEAVGNRDTELWITDAQPKNYNPDGVYAKMSAAELEAHTVAKRIRALVEEEKITVTDGDTKRQRPIRYGDITILMQFTTHLQKLTQVLESYGISVLSEGGEDFFHAKEVAVILDFLRCIDNPTQDIPLVALLRSELFGFSPEELCAIRMPSRKLCFYDALLQAAKDGNQKAENFVKILEQFRQYAAYMGADELIWRIIYDLHYHALVHTDTGDAKLRHARMEHLYELAVNFEKESGHGVYAFLPAIEQQIAAEKSDTVKIDSDAANMVRIMTMHKSKGLEFPVVILFDTEHKFNESDLSKPVVRSEEYGIAMDYVDTVKRIRYASLPRLLMKYAEEKTQRSEGLRLLYVAMTRAKEKLIFSCAPKDKNYECRAVMFRADGKPDPIFTIDKKKMSNWIMLAMLPHPDAEPLRKLCGRTDVEPNPNMKFPLMVHLCHHETAPMLSSDFRQASSSESGCKSFGAFDDSVRQRLEYNYPHEKLTLTPSKLPISELNRETDGENELVTNTPHLKKAILTDTYRYGYAEIGTITHYALQHLDYGRTNSPEEIREQIAEMVAQGKISQHQAEVVSAEKLFGFFSHPLGQRLKSAAKSEREFDFFLRIPASELDSSMPGQDGDETVILQGIADCFFYENGGIVLLDFKTDYATEETAGEKAKFYRTQIDYYARALSEISGCPVNEKYVFFLSCSTAIQM